MVNKDGKITLAHGSGGKLTHELIRHLFLPSFNNDALSLLGDSALLQLNGMRLAFTTDSYVVKPIFFPGGDIGRLAVSGTINDLAVVGARPMFLSAGFIIEEGFEMLFIIEPTCTLESVSLMVKLGIFPCVFNTIAPLDLP